MLDGSTQDEPLDIAATRARIKKKKKVDYRSSIYNLRMSENSSDFEILKSTFCSIRGKSPGVWSKARRDLDLDLSSGWVDQHPQLLAL